MIKNIVTVSLMIFIIAVVGVLGATVFLNQGKVNLVSNMGQVNSDQQSAINNTSTQGQTNTIRGGDEDDDPNDEAGEDGGNYNNGTITTTTAPSVTTPSNPPAVKTPSVVGLTLSQVSTHNTRSNCYMIISNKVYNFTSYMNAHPGGASTIIPLCGKDGTTAFATKGGQGSHSQSAYNLLSSYYVGNLVP